MWLNWCTSEGKHTTLALQFTRIDQPAGSHGRGRGTDIQDLVLVFYLIVGGFEAESVFKESQIHPPFNRCRDLRLQLRVQQLAWCTNHRYSKTRKGRSEERRVGKECREGWE